MKVCARKNASARVSGVHQSAGESFNSNETLPVSLKSSFLEVFLEFSWFWKIRNLQNVYFLRNGIDGVHGAVCESTRLL